jgi:hypothetical protein
MSANYGHSYTALLGDLPQAFAFCKSLHKKLNHVIPGFADCTGNLTLVLKVSIRHVVHIICLVMQLEFVCVVMFLL